MKKILDKIKLGFILLFIIGVIYFIVNIGVLLWFLINPEGFWGFFWFYSLFTGGLYILIQLLIVLFSSIIQWGKKGILYGVPLILLMLVLIAIEFVPTLFISQKLYSKYRYIERTTEHLTNGRYQKALDYAIDIYDDNKNIQSSRFWFLKYLFLNTDKGQLYAENREYQSKLNYALCLYLSGINLDVSEDLFKECDSLAIHYFPDKKDYSLMPLIQLSNLYFSQGLIYESEKINNRLFSKSNAITDEDVYHVVDGLFLRSISLQRLGDYPKAQETLQQAHEIYLKSEKSKKSSYYLQLILSYIKVKYENGDLSEVNDLLNEAEDIAEEDKNRVTYIDYLNYRARYEENQGNIDEAEELYSKALKRCKRKDPVEHANQLRINANYQFRQKEYKKALEFYHKAVEVLFDENYQGGFVAQSQFSGIIKSNFALGDIPLSVKQSKAMDSLMINVFNQYYMILSQDEREKLSYKNQECFDLSNSIYLSANEDEILGNVYNNVLATKSISLLSNNYIENYLNTIGDNELLKLYKDLLIQKENIENNMFFSPNVTPKDQAKLNSISFLQREFNQKLNSLEGYQPFDVADVKWTDVKARLDSNEVAVEFVNFQENPLVQDSLIYYALIIHSNSRFPQRIKLCYEKDIKNIFKRHNNLKDRFNSMYSDGAQSELYKLIWKPLFPHLVNKSQVYVSLTGLLNSVSIPALTLDETYSVKVLSSTRQILNLKNNKVVDVSKSLVFGDINYNTSLNDTLQSEKIGGKRDISIYRSIENSKLRHLGGTQIEVDDIQELLKKNNIKTTVRRGESASEVVFRNLIEMNQPDIIHIATHGFYYPKESSVVMKDNIFKIENDYSVIENPMLRSGLFFAGANDKEKSVFNNDGVLTANEIVAFDLSDVELVVLSACETGLGDVIGNEGVFGLQRAFKMAGASKLVMSLWKVPDEETAKLMSIFYRHYLVDNNAHDALKKAQIEMREIYPEPFYWAGFFVLE
jgi:CHAT domain-containing protein